MFCFQFEQKIIEPVDAEVELNLYKKMQRSWEKSSESDSLNKRIDFSSKQELSLLLKANEYSLTVCVVC